jgi:hypothetical protein
MATLHRLYVYDEFLNASFRFPVDAFLPASDMQEIVSHEDLRFVVELINERIAAANLVRLKRLLLCWLIGGNGLLLIGAILIYQFIISTTGAWWMFAPVLFVFVVSNLLCITVLLYKMKQTKAKLIQQISELSKSSFHSKYIEAELRENFRSRRSFDEHSSRALRLVINIIISNHKSGGSEPLFEASDISIPIYTEADSLLLSETNKHTYS